MFCDSRLQVEPERLDLHYYLPLFFDGLRETRFPESMLARQGVVTLIEMGGDDCVGIVGKVQTHKVQQSAPTSTLRCRAAVSDTAIVWFGRPAVHRHLHARARNDS